MINVVLADDNEIILKALKIVLNGTNEIKVIGTAKDGREAADLANQLLPDLVLMDIKMPVCDGIKGTKLIKEQNNGIKVVMLTTIDEDFCVSEALKFGADGYALKNVSDDDLIKVIKTTMAGFSIVQKNMFDKYREKYGTVPDKCPVGTKISGIKLTEREKEVLSFVVDGMSNKEIAARLFLADGRVKNIISSLLMKLNVEDRTQLAVYAVKQNLV